MKTQIKTQGKRSTDTKRTGSVRITLNFSATLFHLRKNAEKNVAIAWRTNPDFSSFFHGKDNAWENPFFVKEPFHRLRQSTPERIRDRGTNDIVTTHSSDRKTASCKTALRHVHSLLRAKNPIPERDYRISDREDRRPRTKRPSTEWSKNNLSRRSFSVKPRIFNSKKF